MQILVVTGCNLRFNFSAGLSHSAYIKGLSNLGYDVDLLCFSDKGIEIDKGLELPPIRNQYTYDGLSLYERLSGIKSTNDTGGKAQPSSKTDITPRKKDVIKSKIKKMIRSSYGVYRMTIVWYKRAKHFKTNTLYDYVISMSDPPVSHKLAGYLLKSHRINAHKWIQLWEDPWCDSYYDETEINIPCMKEEKKVLSDCKDIVYVSPMTLKRQQEIFPEAASKMRWCPLASYYQASILDYSGYKENYYGYFGDYVPHIRNLEPFYKVMRKKNLQVDICGSPSDLFESIGNVRIHPRLPLDQLKFYEDRSNITVCLFNNGGGQIPGKIYQLASTNKIILAILDGSEEEQNVILDYFGKFNRFVFCKNTFESILETVERIEHHDLNNVINSPIDAFNIETVSERLLGNID
jgi:hypothetical protein